MVLPFFGKKPAPAGSPAPRSRSGSGAVGASPAAARSRPVPRSETSTLDFTIAGGDLNRVLAQCADKVHVEEGVDEMAPPAEEAAILYANGQDIDVTALIAHCNGRLADFKVPRYVAVRGDPLPRLATQKISKPALREEYRDAHLTLPKVR